MQAQIPPDLRSLATSALPSMLGITEDTGSRGQAQPGALHRVARSSACAGTLRSVHPCTWTAYTHPMGLALSQPDFIDVALQSAAD